MKWQSRRHQGNRNPSPYRLPNPQHAYMESSPLLYNQQYGMFPATTAYMNAAPYQLRGGLQPIQFFNPQMPYPPHQPNFFPLLSTGVMQQSFGGPPLHTPSQVQQSFGGPPLHTPSQVQQSFCGPPLHNPSEMQQAFGGPPLHNPSQMQQSCGVPPVHSAHQVQQACGGSTLQIPSQMQQTGQQQQSDAHLIHTPANVTQGVLMAQHMQFGSGRQFAGASQCTTPASSTVAEVVRGPQQQLHPYSPATRMQITDVHIAGGICAPQTQPMPPLSHEGAVTTIHSPTAPSVSAPAQAIQPASAQQQPCGSSRRQLDIVPEVYSAAAIEPGPASDAQKVALAPATSTGVSRKPLHFDPEVYLSEAIERNPVSKIQEIGLPRVSSTKACEEANISATTSGADPVTRRSSRVTRDSAGSKHRKQNSRQSTRNQGQRNTSSLEIPAVKDDGVQLVIGSSSNCGKLYIPGKSVAKDVDVPASVDAEDEAKEKKKQVKPKSRGPAKKTLSKLATEAKQWLTEMQGTQGTDEVEEPKDTRRKKQNVQPAKRLQYNLEDFSEDGDDSSVTCDEDVDSPDE